MAGIDFALLRRQISLTQVLGLIGFTPTTRCGPQWRGPCPVHGSKSPRSRSLAAQVAKNAHKKKISLRESAVELGFLSGEDFDKYVKPEEMTHP